MLFFNKTDHRLILQLFFHGKTAAILINSIRQLYYNKLVTISFQICQVLSVIPGLELLTLMEFTFRTSTIEEQEGTGGLKMPLQKTKYKISLSLSKEYLAALMKFSRRGIMMEPSSGFP